MDARIRKIAVFVAVAAVAFVAAVAILRYVGDGVPTASEGDSGRGPAATVSGKGEIRAVDEEKTGGADPEVADSEPDGDGEKQEDKTPEVY